MVRLTREALCDPRSLDRQSPNLIFVRQVLGAPGRNRLGQKAGHRAKRGAEFWQKTP